MRIRGYTDDQLREAVKSSTSIRQVLQKLGKSLQGGGSYNQLHDDFLRLNLDTSHFLGMGYLKGRTHGWNKKIPFEKLLVENSTYTNRTCLKKRLLREKMLKNECDLCKQIPQWNGAVLVLVLDHKNGTNNDNRLENLRLLCPNCNSQQPTFSGKNKGKF